MIPNESTDAGAQPARPWHGPGHYENFPVASWLMPRALRPAVLAIYRFARHADDIADEGIDSAGRRRERLDALHRELSLAQAGEVNGNEHSARAGEASSEPLAPRVSEPVVADLVEPVRRHGLDWRHFHDLLDAFQQDLTVSRYANADAVDHYCARSANPVGRLMLSLFGAATARNLAASDAICSALQRINFLQDIAVDWAKDRIYVPLASLAAVGVSPTEFGADIASGRLSAASRRVLANEAARARRQLLDGGDLVGSVPRRLGWELRFVIAGGLRILDRLEQGGYDPVRRRPRLGRRDVPALVGLALRVRRMRYPVPTSKPLPVGPGSPPER